MTRSHARNNTTQANLTYYERSLLRKNTAAKRIGGDSFKPLDSCYLCLSKVTDPVACPRGHIYCRECGLTNLITQKASIETHKREMERWQANEERERTEAKMRARERVVLDFSKSMGLGVSGGRILTDGKKESGSGSGSGRFELDGETVERVAKEAEEKALRVIEGEQVEARKAKLAAFWLPSLTPAAKMGPLAEVKLQTMCQVGGEAHPFSRKTLLPVILTYPIPTSKPTCPSCKSELSNSTNSILLSSRTPLTIPDPDGDPELEPKKKKSKKDKEDPYICGHVICKTCDEKIVKESGRCPVCEAKIDSAGRIPLGKEGTGFAAAGGAEVKDSKAVAFRV